MIKTYGNCETTIDIIHNIPVFNGLIKNIYLLSLYGRKTQHWVFACRHVMTLKRVLKYILLLVLTFA